jgi:hypothetical protein
MQTLAGFAIGNQWQFENFLIGCDWIGLNVPVSESISKDKVVSNYSYDITSHNSDRDRLFKNTTGSLLSFYIGASF